jgi:uncharacterized membrane protein YgcG
LHLPHLAALEPTRSSGIRFAARHAGQFRISVVVWFMISRWSYKYYNRFGIEVNVIRAVSCIHFSDFDTDRFHRLFCHLKMKKDHPEIYGEGWAAGYGSGGGRGSGFSKGIGRGGCSGGGPCQKQ